MDVAENNLTSIPEEIGTLTNLKYLRLSRNPITPTIPDSIGNLTRLNMLRLFQTDITSVPETVTKLVNLVELDFGETKVTPYFFEILKCSNFVNTLNVIVR